jgi:hypothetical protein
MAIFTGGPYPSVRLERSRFVRWGLAGALLFVVIAAGCGGSLALDPVASAADKTLDKQTGRFELAIKVSIPQVGRTTISGTGSFDAAEQAAALTMNVPGMSSPTSTMELRMLYPATYVRLENLPLPTDKTWIKVDLQKAANTLGARLPQIGGNPSPADALAQLRGSKNAKKLGTETIDGVKATHYRVKIDLDKALERATPQQRKALKQLVRAAKRDGIDVVPTHVDVWVGDDGLVRRFNEKFGDVGTLAMTFSDYGKPIEIEPPHPDQTLDLSQLG